MNDDVSIGWIHDTDSAIRRAQVDTDSFAHNFAWLLLLFTF